MNGKSIQEIAQSFREAFLAVDLSDAPGSLKTFPGGCCNWASWMLGHYLKFECGLESVEIQAQRPGSDGTSGHVWIEVDGLIIDITSDQFDDCPEPIYGIEISEWHQDWEKVRKEEIRPMAFWDDGLFFCNVKPSEVYERLLTYIRARCA
jgi:hypothetical protein